MKQIILITDGCSNVGISPVVAAAHAFADGVVVNVIGVIDQGEIGEHGATEIADTAKAGGGISRIVSASQLAHTVQMMTRKTVAHTIQQVVNKELRHILGGEGSVEELHPEKRAQVVRAMEELGETTELRVALLIDASASMKPKLAAVEDAIRDLMLSLQARKGASELAVLHFPGNGGDETQLDVAWTRELAKIRNLFYKINMKGTTPTGPALMQTLRYMLEKEREDDAASSRYGLLAEGEGSDDVGKDGMLRDYIV